MTTRRTTSKTLPPTSRPEFRAAMDGETKPPFRWFKDGTDGETKPPLSPSKRRTLLRKASAERQLQYDNGGQPLAVLDELAACLKQKAEETVRVPRWAITAAKSEVMERIRLDRRGGRNVSAVAKAIMESTHRIRYDMVRKAEADGLTGRLKWDIAVALCEEPDLTVKAVQQSYALIKKNPFFGQLSAKYVFSSEPYPTEQQHKAWAEAMKKKLNAICSKHSHRNE